MSHQKGMAIGKDAPRGRRGSLCRALRWIKISTTASLGTSLLDISSRKATFATVCGSIGTLWESRRVHTTVWWIQRSGWRKDLPLPIASAKIYENSFIHSPEFVTRAASAFKGLGLGRVTAQPPQMARCSVGTSARRRSKHRARGSTLTWRRRDCGWSQPLESATQRSKIWFVFFLNGSWMFWNAPFCMCAIRRVNEEHSKLQLNRFYSKKIIFFFVKWTVLFISAKQKDWCLSTIWIFGQKFK